MHGLLNSLPALFQSKLKQDSFHTECRALTGVHVSESVKVLKALSKAVKNIQIRDMLKKEINFVCKNTVCGDRHLNVYGSTDCPGISKLRSGGDGVHG